MARVNGSMVMHGRKDMEYSMYVDFGDDRELYQLRKGGYYLGCSTFEAMVEKMALSTWDGAKIEQLDKAALSTGMSTGGMEPSEPDTNVSKGTASIDEVRTFESLSSTESPKRTTPVLNSPPTAADRVRKFSKEEVLKEEVPREEVPQELVPKEEVSERSLAVVGLPVQPLQAVQPLRVVPPSPGVRPHFSRGVQPLLGVQPLQVVQALPAVGTSMKKPVKSLDRTSNPLKEEPSEEMPLKSVDRTSNPLKEEPSEEMPLKSVDRTPKSPGQSSSEEEYEAKIKEIDDYTIFIGNHSHLVSLCILPLEFASQQLVANGGSLSTSDVSIYGKSRGIDIKRQITAWKLTFPAHEAESVCILVKIRKRSGSNKWVKLEKPHYGYKKRAQEFLSVASFLAFMKKDPHASEESVRTHLVQGDLLPVNCDHLRMQRSLMEQFIDLDPTLKETDARKILLSLTLEKVPVTREKREKRALVLNDDSSDEDTFARGKKTKVDYTRPNDDSSDEDTFARAKETKVDYTRPDDVIMHESESEEEYYEDEGLHDTEDDVPGDTFCSFCDDGGDLLLCDGPCLRSFHPTRESGSDTNCKSLGFSNGTDMSRTKTSWFCTNCKTKKHQCYACGELGNSDVALGPERKVFVCDVASCGKFYHPRCVVNQLMPKGTAEERRAMMKGIRTGEESFTCPLHRCQKCGKGEEKKERGLNLAICRRCPKAWHVDCLPRNISFDRNRESDFEVRAWEIGKRFIIYCTNHRIIPHLGTPTRDHIKFSERTPETTQVSKKPQKQVSILGNERPGRKAIASSSSVSQKLGRSAETAKPATQLTIGDDAKSLVDDIMTKSRMKITEESVKKKIVLPGIYKPREFSWMPKGRFDSILNGARAAMEKFNRGNDWEDARLKCAREQVVAICYEEDRLRTFLAPTLHGKRYTSYGRHFTKIEKLQKVVEVLQPHIRDGDTIVDFSCGDNTFSRMLSNALSNADKSNCQYKNFDIFTPKDTFGFVRQDWLSVRVNECGPGDNLVIGLNPPFAHLDQFISHALSMEPRILVLIVPPLTKPMADYGYSCLLDDHTTMAEKSFYLPGSVHGLNDEYLEQGNSTAPHLYIFEKNSFFGASNPPSTANLAQPIPPVHKSRKAAKLKLPTSTSPDPIGHLFIPPIRKPVRDPRDVSVPPQHMANRMYTASGSAPQTEEGEVLRPPPSHQHRQSRFANPQPRGRFPARMSQFHARPQNNPPFQPRRPPFHHNQDEYSPYAPEMFPPGHHPRDFPRHDPRGLPLHYPPGDPFYPPPGDHFHHPPGDPFHPPGDPFHPPGDPFHPPGVPRPGFRRPDPRLEAFRGVAPRDQSEYGGWLPDE